MPTPTYVPLATVTLGSSATTVTFSSIPGTYRDLVLIVAGTVSSGHGLRVRYNGDATDANYSRVFMFGVGSGSPASTTASDAVALEMGTAQTLASGQIMDYSATDKHKTGLFRGGAGNSFTFAQANRWANTAAITSLQIAAVGGITISTGTVLSLYGIVA